MSSTSTLNDEKVSNEQLNIYNRSVQKSLESLISSDNVSELPALYTTFLLNLEILERFVCNLKPIPNYFDDFFEILFFYAENSLKKPEIHAQFIKCLSYATVLGDLSEYSQFLVDFFFAHLTGRDLRHVEEQLFESVYSLLFRSPDFLQSFADSKGIVRVFEIGATTLSSPELLEWCTHAIFSSRCIHEWQPSDYLEFFSLFTTLVCDHFITPKLVKPCINFFSAFFSIGCSTLGEVSFLFSENDCLVTIDLLLLPLSVEERVECYKDFLMASNNPSSSGPNMYVLTHIHRLSDQSPQFAQHATKYIVEAVKRYPHKVKEMNSTVPFISWMRMCAASSVELMVSISAADPSFCVECLPGFLREIREKGLIESNYSILIDMFMKLIELKQLSFQQLLNLNFLNTFVCNINQSLVVNSFEQSGKYLDLVLSVYSLPDAISFQPTILKYILDTRDYFHHTKTFMEIAARMLVAAPSHSVIRIIQSAFTTQNYVTYERILASAFTKSQELCSIFVKNNGLLFLNSLLENKVLSIDALCGLIASLVSNRRIKEVDEFIYDLPKDHPIYQLSQDKASMITYGNHDPFSSDIRVYSLLYNSYLEFPLSPYKAYKIGKNYKYIRKMMPLSEFNNITNSIRNRYIEQEEFDELFDNFEAVFDTSEELFDKRLDHFPIYQVDPSYGSHSISTSFPSLSFWIKLSDIPHKPHLVFKYGPLKASAFSNGFEIGILSQTAHYKYDPTQWCHVFLFSTSHQVLISLQGDSFVFSPETHISQFTKISFYSSQNNILYLGPSILFLMDNVEDITPILSKGPGAVITDQCTLHKPEHSNSIHFVPYKGFPVYFDDQNVSDSFLKSISKEKDQLRLKRKLILLKRLLSRNLIVSISDFISSLSLTPLTTENAALAVKILLKIIGPNDVVSVNKFLTKKVYLYSSLVSFLPDKYMVPFLCTALQSVFRKVVPEISDRLNNIDPPESLLLQFSKNFNSPEIQAMSATLKSEYRMSLLWPALAIAVRSIASGEPQQSLIDYAQRECREMPIDRDAVKVAKDWLSVVWLDDMCLEPHVRHFLSQYIELGINRNYNTLQVSESLESIGFIHFLCSIAMKVDLSSENIFSTLVRPEGISSLGSVILNTLLKRMKFQRITMKLAMVALRSSAIEVDLIGLFFRFLDHLEDDTLVQKILLKIHSAIQGIGLSVIDEGLLNKAGKLGKVVNKKSFCAWLVEFSRRGDSKDAEEFAKAMIKSKGKEKAEEYNELWAAAKKSELDEKLLQAIKDFKTSTEQVEKEFDLEFDHLMERQRILALDSKLNEKGFSE